MKTDLIERNMSLSLEFSRYLLDHPEVEASIPEGAYVVLLPEDDPELCEFNTRVAEAERTPGQATVKVRLAPLQPEQRSRIVGVKVDPAPVG
jgi:hypothetical protein